MDDRIEYAVILAETQEGELHFAARHIYPSFTAARHCAAAYLRDLGCAAAVANIAPPLELARSQDYWGVLEVDRDPPEHSVLELGPTLRIYGDRRAALEAAKHLGGYPVPTPIRQAMPVGHGVPQFA